MKLRLPSLVPDRILLVVGMQFYEFLGIDMPERAVDSCICILIFPSMAERTPPVLHNFHQIRGIAEQGDAQGAVELAVEDPEKPVARRMQRRDVDNRLRSVPVPVRDPIGDKIHIRLYLHAADILQMRFDQQYPDNHERYGRQNRQVDERNAENYFPEGLFHIVAADSYPDHYAPYYLLSFLNP